MSSRKHTSFPGTFKEINHNSSVARTWESSLPNLNTLNTENGFTLILPESDTMVYKKSYVICYDHRTKIPKYVIEYLTAANRQSDSGSLRRMKEFEEDKAIPEFYRSKVLDYTGSSYDKGHMARAKHYRHDKEAFHSTYLLSNIAPQIHSFNDGIWNSLEQRVVSFINEYESVLVWIGPLFIPKKDTDGKFRVTYEVIGDNVAVPTHFFKVILGIKDGKAVMESYVLEHKDIENNSRSPDLKTFMVDKAYIEKYAGYRIFKGVSDEILKRVNNENKEKKIKSKI